MKIRKTHILARHFFNVQDNSAGNFFTEEDGWLDWLWCVIEETDCLFINDTKEIMKKRTSRCWGARKSRAKDAHDIYNGLSMGPERTKVTWVLIVYDYWKQLVITAYHCVVALRFLQPEEDDGWISS